MVSTPLQALSAASYLGDCDDFVVVALKPADRVSLAQLPTRCRRYLTRLP